MSLYLTRYCYYMFEFYNCLIEPGSANGVAPRAKMKYQRIKRFRAAKEAARKVSLQLMNCQRIRRFRADKAFQSCCTTTEGNRKKAFLFFLFLG
ncbi:hypothetical protein HanXRQr2_Chr02g0070681 [Helianthus annuus]|uniref:Putative 5-3 exonuclease n=1 Tax=Helianthus annuus TaxID=4232 RepID=A0A251TQE5_HELAN|nr:hypothetical protein HanXRQr2_Chr02g0070681 [Helianthus annuus]